ncbi:MAG: tetratricopeptide repeat protein [Thermonemataceae bacterium]
MNYIKTKKNSYIIISILLLQILIGCKRASSSRQDKVIAQRYADTANKYMVENKYDLALSYLDKAITHDTISADYFHNRGVVKSQLEKHKEAILDFDKALDKYTVYTYDKGEAESYCMRGANYQSMGLYEKALEDYTKAVTIDTINTNCIVLRANLYFKMGDTLRACEDWKKAKSLGDDWGRGDIRLYCK